MSYAPALVAPQTGDVLDARYRLAERLGAGAMGRVYRARDEVLRRDVAVKVYDAEPRDDLDPGRRAAEARALASLDHPSLVTLYDARVTGDGPAYLVMELVPGRTLQHRIETGPMSSAEVAAIVHDLADALATVHAAGIVHRDIKPSNVLLRTPLRRSDPPTAVLADFGVAHLLDAPRLTAPGMIIGTAAYLAPEQVRGEAPQAASDVYALGLLTIEMLTRLHPFHGATIEETVLARLHRQPVVPGDHGYPWKSLLTAMTSPEPRERPTADEVAARAATIGATSAVRPSPRREARARMLAEATATAPTLTLADLAEANDAAEDAPEGAVATRRGRPRGGRPGAHGRPTGAAAMLTGIHALLALFGDKPTTIGGDASEAAPIARASAGPSPRAATPPAA
ncbi:serine/threonine-protein kinase [Microbacterium trichothecenolyticum]|uniref:non-specific serine/threonine protein kinase n=1 Tax=Microbacterium trichothecenolyticum TaxID=69370 RepID=A0ABU0TV47_MICTR|nr:serine/threonine-protein kinase [Microbacterium trichothecenolyticum]MDQ1123375.1 serine/threonine protein kinase [Microbacterium trichothecenolyticum]